MSQFGAPPPPPPPPPYGAPPPPPMYPSAGPVPASMGLRLGARLIDGVLLGIVCGVLGAIFFGLSSSVQADPATGDVTGLQEAIAASAGRIVLSTVIGLLYEVTLIGTRGATIGKQVLGIRVLREVDGAVPGMGPAFVRWIVPNAASALTCGIGGLLVYLSPFWDSAGRFQGWHDKAAKTLVVKV